MPYGESDAVVGLFSESLGKITAIARRSRKKGTLEPMHTLAVTLSEPFGTSMLGLSQAEIVTPRFRLIGMLDRMQAAGAVLRWIRQATPVRTPELETWGIVQDLLDVLDRETLPMSPQALMVVTGLRLLVSFGYGLDLGACVVCRRCCPVDRSAYVDPVRGGLVCRRCGGAGVMLSAEVRDRALGCVWGGALLEESDVPVLQGLVESALLAHASVKSGGAGR
ncbi:MAG: DNA repair protein RecO [Polyangiaceae bacterium]|nr:DNA repair protein RecO [Polyangiaceae bacterium]